MTSEPTGVEAGLTVAAVARRMGVAPATLRTWDRRYGVGPSEHLPGTHRRYTSADLARLEHMRRLVIAGVPPAHAAQAARECPAEQLPIATVTELPVPPLPEGTLAATEAVPDGARAGGGRVIALPGQGPAVRGLARAAQALDAPACSRIVLDSLEQHGTVWTWDHLVVPVLAALGRQWSSTGSGVDVEHALSGAVQDALSAWVRRAPSAVTHRTVVLACAPGEMHSLPLWAVAAALAESRISARILGASLPASALANAVDRLGPAAVFVWAQLPAAADAELLVRLPAARPAACVLVGGPGWASIAPDLPTGVVMVRDLADTVARIGHAVGR